MEKRHCVFLHEKDRGPQGQQLGEVSQQAGDVDACNVKLLEGSKVQLDAPLVEPIEVVNINVAKMTLPANGEEGVVVGLVAWWAPGVAILGVGRGRLVDVGAEVLFRFPVPILAG